MQTNLIPGAIPRRGELNGRLKGARAVNIENKKALEAIITEGDIPQTNKLPKYLASETGLVQAYGADFHIGKFKKLSKIFQKRI